MGCTGAQQQQMKEKKAKVVILMLGKEICNPGQEITAHACTVQAHQEVSCPPPPPSPPHRAVMELAGRGSHGQEIHPQKDTPSTCLCVVLCNMFMQQLHIM